MTPTLTRKGLTQDEQVVKQLGFKYDLIDVPLTQFSEDSSKFNYRLTRLDEELALQYGIAMENGAEFPPIVAHAEKAITGLVIDSGIHRFHGRKSTNFKTISTIRLKDLDLTDPLVAQKLDVLRVRLNLTHGRGLDQAERRHTACNWIDQGFMSEEDAAGFFDLDPKVLHEAFEVFQLDAELRRFTLHPENFTRTGFKRAVLRKGLTQSDMKELERVLVRYTAEDQKRKITTAEFNKLSQDIADCRGVDMKKQAVFEKFRAAKRTKPKGAQRGGTATITGSKARLNGICVNVKDVDPKVIAEQQTNSEMAQGRADEVYAAILKLAAVHDAVAKRFGLPQVSVIR